MTRTVDVRVDVIRNGATVTSLSSADTPVVKMSDSAVIKSSFRGQFLPNEEVNWLFDELKPVIIIDGVEEPMGIFAPATITKTRADGQTLLSVEAYDRCWLVQCKKTESILHLSSGTNYITAIESLLNQAGINLIIKTPTSNTLTSDREDWDIGTDYLTIINDLLDEINYNDLWFDKQGNAVLEPDSFIAINQVERTYDCDAIGSMVIDSSSMTLDLFNTPNVFICVCSNPDGDSVLTSTAENNNAASPFSILNRGKRIMSLKKVNNIASQSELNDYAAILRNESMFVGNTLEINTAIRTDCGFRDVTAINHPSFTGLGIESEWEVSLGAGGTMKHKIQTQPIAVVSPSPSGTSAVVGIAIAGISIVGTE